MNSSLNQTIKVIVYFITSIVIIVYLGAGCLKLYKKDAVDTISTMQIRDYVYKNHSYIIFVKDVGRWQSMGIEHNPDCDCLKNVEGKK